jgi:hypothetical protein
MYGQFEKSLISCGSIFNASQSSGTFQFFISGTLHKGLELIPINTFGAFNKYQLIF